MKANYGATEKLTISALVMALYVALMALTQGFAFGQYQIRIATALYALGGLFPFLVIPLGLANFLSNLLLGGLGLSDMIGGALAGFATAGAAALAALTAWPKALTAAAIVFIPGLMVPLWLSPILNVPYGVLAPVLVCGQILPGLAGALLLSALKKRFQSHQSPMKP